MSLVLGVDPGYSITFDNRSLDEGLRGPERTIEALKRNIRLVYDASSPRKK